MIREQISCAKNTSYSPVDSLTASELLIYQQNTFYRFQTDKVCAQNSDCINRAGSW